MKTSKKQSARASEQSIRLYVEAGLAASAQIACDSGQANYLNNVMRLRAGDRLLIFNGRDGEWQAEITGTKRGECFLTALEQTRPQSGGPDIHYLFAPLKKARLDYMGQKATEMGVAVLRPVITQRTIAERVNLDRMRANIIEAAEQCGILRLPEICEPEKLLHVLDGWPQDRALIFADEAAEIASPVEALGRVPDGPVALLVGPEGGFDEAEREALRRKPFVHVISLGDRIMRADTAAVAALALINAVRGDWR